MSAATSAGMSWGIFTFISTLNSMCFPPFTESFGVSGFAAVPVQLVFINFHTQARALRQVDAVVVEVQRLDHDVVFHQQRAEHLRAPDRKSTRLNSSDVRN